MPIKHGIYPLSSIADGGVGWGEEASMIFLRNPKSADLFHQFSLPLRDLTQINANLHLSRRMTNAHNRVSSEAAG